MPYRTPGGKASTPRFSCLADLLAYYARVARNRQAILAPGHAPLTYGALWEWTNEVMRALRGIGVGTTDRVAVVLPEGPEALMARVAVAAGAACVPLYPGFTADEWRRYLADLRIAALVTCGDMASASRRAAAALRIPTLEVSLAPGQGLRALRRACSATGRAVPEGFASSSEDALILMTSGTTARPKRVPLTHANVCLSASNVAQSLELTPQDRLLSVLPLFHGHGLISGVLAALTAGSSVVATSGFDAQAFFRWLAEFGPTWFTAVPAIHRAVLVEAGRAKIRAANGSLRLVRSASASLPPDVLIGLEALFGVPVVECYGMTEAATQIAANPLGRRKLGSVGMPTGCEIAIMDGGARPLPAGERGEIALRGPTLTRGYDQDAAATASAFRDGWFRTGDLGYLDREGFLFIVGRTKQADIINRGGQKVAPAEVEAALLRHPDVTEAVVFPVAHRRLGEDVAAAVVLRRDAKVTPPSLRQFLAKTLARYKVPGRIGVVPGIAKRRDGKIDRDALVRAHAEERAGGRRRGKRHAPRSPLEEQLAQIWADLLELEDLSVDQDVFALGADSLSVTQLLSRLRTRFLVDIAFEDIFTAPTIAAQAARLEALQGRAAVASVDIDAAPTDAHGVSLSFQQQRILILSSLDPLGYNYHIVEVARLTGQLDAEALERSIATICQRHEALRTTYLASSGEPVQTVGTVCPHLERFDLAPCPTSARTPAVRLHVRQLLGEPFAMQKGPLVRAQLMRFDDRDHALVMKLHHLVTDGWSRRLLWE